MKITKMIKTRNNGSGVFSIVAVFLVPNEKSAVVNLLADIRLYAVNSASRRQRLTLAKGKSKNSGSCWLTCYDNTELTDFTSKNPEYRVSF